MFFIVIFEEFGVNYIGEDARRLLHIDRYNEMSLHHMDYRKWMIDGYIVYLDRDLLLLIFQTRMEMRMRTMMIRKML